MEKPEKCRNTISSHRVVGPPGTGKTTWMIRQAQRRVEQWCHRTGLPPQRCGDVLVATLTKAAAYEASSRDIVTADGQIATLHSHCYRAMGRPSLMASKGITDEFNQWVSKQNNGEGARFIISPQGGERTELGEQKNPGDRLLETHNLFRSRLLDPLTDPRGSKTLRDFSWLYKKWKRENDVMDFTDCIEQVYLDDVPPPGGATALFVDECQDNDRLEVRTLLKWAEQAEHIIWIGDADQSLYGWRGGDTTHLLRGQFETSRILSQSYRVPRAVLDYALSIRNRIADKIPDQQYEPRSDGGEVIRKAWTFLQDADEIVRWLDREYISQGQSVMLLAPTHYGVAPIINELKQQGITYHNPYAKTQGQYNPYSPGRGKLSSLDRLRQYLIADEGIHHDKARLWTPSEMWSFVEWMQADGLLVRGAKEQLKQWRRNPDYERPMSLEDINSLFVNGLCSGMERVSVDWLVSTMSRRHQRKMQNAARVYHKRGFDSLIEEPKVIVGTVHSVKGGEAPVVVVSPELSYAFYETFSNKDTRDEVHRIFYVAATRARETLVLCEGAGEFAYPW